MSAPIRAAIFPQSTRTRVVVRQDSSYLLKARLSPRPAHPRALPRLLEAIALWQGRKVHAVLSAGGWDGACVEDLLRDSLADFGGPFYSLQLTERATHPRPRDELRVPDDIKQLQLFDGLWSSR